MPRRQNNDPIEPQSPEGGPDAGDLRSVERLLKTLQTTPADPFVLPKRKARETNDNTSALQTWASQPLPDVPTTEQRDGFLAWLFLCSGATAFACGAGMLVWSVAQARAELWTLGVPLILGGQGAVIFGLIGLVEGAAQRHKHLAAALHEHRQRLTIMQNLALSQPQRPMRQAA